MRVVIDLQAAQSPGSRIRGIGRYSLSLAEAIVRNAGDHEIWIALNHGIPDVVDAIKGRLCRHLPEGRIVVWETIPGTAAVDPSNLHARRVAECLRERFLDSLAPDVVHTSSLFEGLTDDVVASIPKRRGDALQTVSLYDLIPYVRSDVYLQDARARDWYLDKIESLARADLLLGISEYTCREAVEQLSIDPVRVTNISAGLSEEFHVLDMAERDRARIRIRERFDLAERFVIYTGGFDSRKNIDGLIRAFGMLPRDVSDGVQLVLVGHGPRPIVDHLIDVARGSGLGERDVLFTGYVDDGDLCALYNLCALHVFPSFHEGFGLPVLEAMACGAPVIGANTTSLPEVIGLDEAMFNPHSARDIADHIARGLTDGVFRARLRAHAATQVGKFSWDASAALALRAMETLHASRPRKPCGRGAAVSMPGSLRALASEVCAHIPDADAFAALALPASRAMALNTKPAKPQLLVDVTVLSALDIGTGIQRVVRNIAQCLLTEGHPEYDIRPVRFEHGVGYLHANAFAARMAKTEPACADDPVDAYPGDVLLGLDLIAHIVPPERPYYEWLRRRGVKVWFVVYDMLPVMFPHYFRDEVRMPFVPWYETIGEVASGLACISASVADEVRDWFDQTQPRRAMPLPIAHFHLGADLDPGQPAMPARSATGRAQGKTFLMVGTVEPRKGHALVLDAFERLWARGEDVRLVIVGKQGWLVDDVIARIRRLVAMGRVAWHDNADDTVLTASYVEADALIMASEGEGFGLPLIEAAQNGLPLIARDLPVFREVAGDGAFYFHGDAEALAEAVRTWIGAYDAGRHPRPEALAWLTWRQSTEQLLAVLANPEHFRAWLPGHRYTATPANPCIRSLPKGLYSVELLPGGPCEAGAVVALVDAALAETLHRIELPRGPGDVPLRLEVRIPHDVGLCEVQFPSPGSGPPDLFRCTLTPASASGAGVPGSGTGNCIKDSINA